MFARILGAVLILAGCGGFGMLICFTYKKEEDMLRQLIRVLELMESELRFRLTPLPQLCRLAGKGCYGKIGQYFCQMGEELDKQIAPDVRSCAVAAGKTIEPIPEQVDKALEILVSTLGLFDVQGQLRGLEAARSHCRAALEELGQDRDMRLRSYQTLGLCAGAALVILLV